MPPIDSNTIPPEMLAAWLAQFQNPPSYSGSAAKGGYMPPSLEQNQKSLNLTQDMLGSLFDNPMVALLAGPTAYTNLDMMGQKYDAGNTAGVQAMMDLVQNPASAGSAEAQIAGRILDGQAPMQAVQEVAAMRPELLGADGKVDSSWTKIAQDFYKQKSEYQAPSGPQTPWEAAALYDPQMQFTPQLLSGQELSQSQSAVDKAKKAKQAATGRKDKMASYEADQSAYEKAMRAYTDARLAVDKSYTSDSASRRSGVNVTMADIAPYVPGNQSATYRAPVDLSVGNPGMPMPVAPTMPTLGSRGGHMTLAQANQGLAFAGQDLNKAMQNDSMARLRASADARAAQQQYGTPMMMQISQRLAALRQMAGLA